MNREIKKRKRRRRKLKMLKTFEECIDSLFVTDSVQKMKDIKHHVNLTCLDHSLFVSYVSYRICKFLKWDYKAAARGGLLHDLFLYDWRKSDAPDGWHGSVHPKVALKNAEELFESLEGEELNFLERDMIVKHMWPVTFSKPSYKESMIVCMVDKICAVTEMALVFKLIKFKSRYFEKAAA